MQRFTRSMQEGTNPDEDDEYNVNRSAADAAAVAGHQREGRNERAARRSGIDRADEDALNAMDKHGQRRDNTVASSQIGPLLLQRILRLTPHPDGTPPPHAHASTHAPSPSQVSSAFSQDEQPYLQATPISRAQSPTAEQLVLERQENEVEEAARREEAMRQLIDSNLERPDPRDERERLGFLPPMQRRDSESCGTSDSGHASEETGSSFEDVPGSSDQEIAGSTSASASSAGRSRPGKNQHRNFERKRRRLSSSSNSSHSDSRSQSPMDHD